MIKEASSPTAGPKPRLAVQAFWMMVARGMGFVFTLLMPLIIVRVFSQHEFGIYKQAFMVVATAQMILPFGFGLSAFYFLPRMPERSREIIATVVLYYVAIGLLVLLAFSLWPDLLRLILGTETVAAFARANLEYAHASALIGAIIATWVFGSFLEVAATAKQDVFFSVVAVAGSQFSRAILLAGSAWMFGTVQAVLYAAVLQGVLQSIATVLYLHRRFPFFWTKFSRSVARSQVDYLLPVGFIGLVVILQNDLPNYVVAHTFSTAEYAIYAVGIAQLPLVGILRDAIHLVMQPRLNELHHAGDRRAMMSIVLKAWRALSAVLIPFAVVLFLLSYEFVTLMYTKDYAASVPIFRLNLVALLLSIVIVDPVIRAFIEYRFWFLRRRLVSLAAQVVLSILCAHYFGLTGALIAFFITQAAERLVLLQLMRKLLGFSDENKMQLLSIAKVIVATAIAGVIVFAYLTATPGSGLLVRLVGGSVVFGLIYVGVLLRSGFLDREERAFVYGYVAKAKALLPAT